MSSYSFFSYSKFRLKQEQGTGNRVERGQICSWLNFEVSLSFSTQEIGMSCFAESNFLKRFFNVKLSRYLARSSFSFVEN